MKNRRITSGFVPASEGSVVLLTLPFWVLLLLPVSALLGGLYRPTRRRRLLGPWVVLVVVVLVSQATSWPHGLWAAAWYLSFENQDTRRTLEDIDFVLSRPQRDEVVRRAAAGELAPFEAEYARPEDFLLPDGFTGLADSPVVWVRGDDCGIRVFFLTVRGFSPDPYGGFEYATPGCKPELDPLGSGRGRARDLGAGWYWIDAS